MTTCWYFPARPLCLLPCFLPPLSIFWLRNTWIFSARGNVGICGRHGKNKQSRRSVRQQRSSAPCLEVGGRELTHFFLNLSQLPWKYLYVIFPSRQAKFTAGLPLIPQGKETPWALKQSIQACFPSKDIAHFEDGPYRGTKNLPNLTVISKQVDITAYSQIHHKTVATLLCCQVNIFYICFLFKQAANTLSVQCSNAAS